MDIKNKIEQIDCMLDNEEELNKYIYSIENNNILVDEKIKNRLLSKIKVNKKNKINMHNILKIAACMLFSLAAWKVVGGENINISTDVYTTYDIYSNIEEKFNEISAFMMSPKVFEGGDN